MVIFKRGVVAVILAMPVLLVGWSRVSTYLNEIKSRNILANDVVRVELAGQKFNIPMRYRYGSNFVEKEGRWVRPKSERLKVVSFDFDVLAPDLRPYREEEDAIWREQWHPDRLRVSVDMPQDVTAKFPEGRYYYVYQGIKNSTAKGFLVELPDHNGMLQFRILSQQKPGTSERKIAAKVFFSKDFNIYIYCYFDKSDQGCFWYQNVYNKYEISYIFRVKYFKDILSVQNRMIELIEAFKRDGHSDNG